MGTFMQISKINQNIYKQNFSAEYKTEDVLRLITGFPYKDKSSKEIIKSLTGIDIYSKEYHSSMPKESEYLFNVIALESLCCDRVLEQKKELHEADSSYDDEMPLKAGKKQTENWFKKQIKKIGKTINIEPFSIPKDEIIEKSNSFYKIFFNL